MRRRYWVLVFIFFALNYQRASAQFFEFEIKESGVYKLSGEKARSLGLGDLSQISFFGYPGMLPQKLDSTQLQLLEIPSWRSEDELWVFLQGPHTIALDSTGDIHYQHHLYSNALSYWIGKNNDPKRIAREEFTESTLPSPDFLYQLYPYKEEKTNLLDSGRDWYSLPIRQGQSLNINFGLTSEASAPWLIQGRSMAQSSSSSLIRILSGNTLLEEIEFLPIPNTLYGIKGREQKFSFTISPSDNRLSQLRFTYQASVSNSSGYLDYVAVGAPRTPNEWRNGIFHSISPVRFTLPNAGVAWEITDFFHPIASAQNVASGKKWAIFSPDQIPEIESVREVTLSRRLQPSESELLIIASEDLLSSARKLQAHKQSLGVSTEVVPVNEIYKEFGYGNPDLTAIRNFIAWEYHQGKVLKNVLVLGKGTFDYKGILGGRPNLLPIYTSRSSLNPLTTYSSDDYLGLIEWGQGQWEENREGDERMQIGVGRIPAISHAEANEIVEKIIRYETDPLPGKWKHRLSFLADDADNNIHMRDAEAHIAYLEENHPGFLAQKLYLDRFEQVNSSGSQSSPAAKEALQKALDEGTLLLNFIGHGNETTLTAEEIFQVSDLPNWPKQPFLPIWMTATCEFGRHDSPFIRSAAEELLFAEQKGGIALLTTGRPVFSSVNFTLNKEFIEELLASEEGRYQDLGTIFKNTKNQSLNGPLNRNFSLLGDPSLRLPLPELQVSIGKISQPDSENETDTLTAQQEYELFAQVVDPLTGAIQPTFQGEYQLEIRDKPVNKSTLGDENSPFGFSEESTLLVQGKGKVVEGKLVAKIFVPKNMDLNWGEGKIRIWAASDSDVEAFGSERKKMGGIAADPTSDREGPEITIFPGGMTSPPYLFNAPSIGIVVHLEDPSGINISDLVSQELLTIQVNEEAPVYVGRRFEAVEGGFSKGSFSIRISGLKEGKNLIRVRAWDNVGNGSEKQIEIQVEGSKELRILTHLVFPNPATEVANFRLSHNRPGENLMLTFQVYNLLGQILLSESYRLVRAEETIGDLSWFFFQSQTKYPAKGTYIYKLTLQSESDFNFDSKSGKLVIR
ncbi:type IX secretion system sortase PorU [Algoriphagus confluentis]|uniref:Type IX secretion system sortase PorU n=1 Tax=Algoriphagus confluentis TaxID=1697556 RepID=A0ABQ6PRD4_9BACT|nr:type IX secretion system sortase PorU [Algoriphagus confluentis]